MTDTNTDDIVAQDEDTATGADPAADSDTQQTDNAIVDEHTEPTGNAEAARYRKRLRETEGARDQLAARLEALQRQQIEHLLTATGVKPAAIWAIAQLPDLIADDGTVDTAKVTAAINTARTQFGINAPQKGVRIPGVGNQPNGIPKGDDWTDAFRRKR